MTFIKDAYCKQSKISDAYLILTHPSESFDTSMGAKHAMQKLADSFDEEHIVELLHRPSYLKHEGKKVGNLYDVGDELMESGLFVCCGGYWTACHNVYAFDVLEVETVKMHKDIEIVFPLDGIYYTTDSIFGSSNISKMLGKDKILSDFESSYIGVHSTGAIPRFNVLIDGVEERVINSLGKPVITVNMFHNVNDTLDYLYERTA